MKKEPTENKNNKKQEKENNNQGLHLDFIINNSFENMFKYKKSQDSQDIITRLPHFFNNEKSIFYLKNLEYNKVVHCFDQIEIKDNCETLFRARKSKNDYYELIYPIVKIFFSEYKDIKKLDKRMWYLLESDKKDFIYETNNEEYNLEQNDIIKFGQRKYEIIEKHINNQIKKENNLSDSIFYKYYPVYENNNNTKIICSICNEGNSNEKNPKIKLCKCEKYTHYNCLKQKVKNIGIKKNKNENVTSYICKKFECNECHSPYPYTFYIPFESGVENKYSLMDLEIPENDDYIILESLNTLEKENKHNIKTIFVIKLSDNEIKIGNAYFNDIIDEDNSVSREHGILKYDKSNGVLKIINKGRFGTSVLIRNNFKLKMNKKLYLQIGNVYIKAENKGGKNIKEE